MSQTPGHRLVPLTGLQRLLMDLGVEARQYWLLPCWIEINMGRCQAERDAQAQCGGERATYTAYVLKAIADAIRASMSHNPEFNGALVRFPWRRMVHFDRVDAAVTVERKRDGQDCFFVGIIRDADRKSVEEISRELAGLRAEGSGPSDTAFERLQRLTRVPSLFRRVMLWCGRNLPGMIAEYRGTFFLSTVGKYGVGMYLMSNHNLSFSFGEVAPRPIVQDGAIAVAPMTTLTVVYDHRVMVGAPVARLMADVRNRLESRAVSVATASQDTVAREPQR